MEFLSNNETGLIVALIIVALLSLVWLVSYLKSEVGVKEVEDLSIDESSYVKDTQYNEKKTSDVDFNRFGRFKVEYSCGKVATKVGNLSNILNNTEVVKYREIK